jgi:hypothetical protein
MSKYVLSKKLIACITQAPILTDVRAAETLLGDDEDGGELYAADTSYLPGRGDHPGG